MTTATDTNGGATKVFDYTVNFQTPLVYDHSLGNLLLDVNIPSGATVSGPGFGFVTLDTIGNAGDGVASVVNIGSGSVATGTVGTDAAVAQFTFTAVPEPTSLAGILIGCAALLKRSRRVESFELRSRSRSIGSSGQKAIIADWRAMRSAPRHVIRQAAVGKAGFARHRRILPSAESQKRLMTPFPLSPFPLL